MKIAQEVIKKLTKKSKSVSTAESCTGGRIASMISSISGSSEVFFGGFVVNCNQAKTKLLNISEKKIKGAKVYSEETAKLMAENALKNTDTDFAISSTGVAEGVSEGIEEGNVWIGIAEKNQETKTFHLKLEGSREEIQKKSSEEAINLFQSLIV